MAPDRYARQARLPEIGAAGQARIRAGSVLVVGCGALGGVAAEILARAGAGTITVVDRDVVEATNLQRQFLFDETDARRATPKAEAAKARLAKVNGEVRVRAFVDDLTARNVRRYLEGVDVVVDGLDNLETRYVLNDAAVEAGIPYVYGAAVGTGGMFATVVPGRTPCLRCLAPELPPPGTVATCELAGVLASATVAVAAAEAAEAIKLLVGDFAAIERGLVSVDLWRGTRTRHDRGEPDPACDACGLRRFPALDEAAIPAAALCGQDAVRVPLSGRVDLAALLDRLAPFGTFHRRDGRIDGSFSPGTASVAGLVVFADGVATVRGTRDPETARSIVARFVGT
jgi:molybdopterin/thiamine biosynthesis adenylyltransferase